MGLFDAYRYDGKRAVIVGGATGMGAAAAALVADAGAEVVVMDIVDVDAAGVTSIRVDMSDRQSIEAAVDECGGPIHALFSCAGVAEGTPGIERINFIGHRHMIDRMLAADMIPAGGAIAMISSFAGIGWESNIDTMVEFLAMDDFDEAAAWCRDNGKAGYVWTKQAINAFVAQRALPLIKQGIRINAILPGPTDTPLAQANKEQWLGFGADYREEAGIEAATPAEQAYALAFLNSDAAAAVNGITMITDAGYTGSGTSLAFPSATEAVKFMRGDYGPIS